MAQFKSQDGEAVNGLTRQHFSAVAYVVAVALEAYDARHRDDEPGTGAVAMGFCDDLFGKFCDLFAESNPNFDRERFSDAWQGEQRLAQARMMRSYGITSEQVEELETFCDDMAKGLCDAVEANSGKTIEQSVADDSLADDVADAATRLKEEMED